MSFVLSGKFPIASGRVNTVLLFACLFLPACTTITEKAGQESLLAYTVNHPETQLQHNVPVFLVEAPEHIYNRIGTARARMTEGEAEVIIDPQQATVYASQQSFSTDQGDYLNFIFRIHFQKVPFRLVPFNLTMGKNVGLLIIVTMDRANRPLLYTMVHTCGCYLSFVPTSYLPETFFPDKWTPGRQQVFGESLPGLLHYEKIGRHQSKVTILIRSDNHRIKDVWLSEFPSVMEAQIAPLQVKPIEQLERLTLGGANITSFYETEGARKHYVKESSKPWERLLMRRLLTKVSNLKSIREKI